MLREASNLLGRRSRGNEWAASIRSRSGIAESRRFDSLPPRHDSLRDKCLDSIQQFFRLVISNGLFTRLICDSTVAAAFSSN